MTHAAYDPATVSGPAHYRGASGRQSIEITHLYRLGPDLTQAVDYILRAGRKTKDPRQDLAKAVYYLRFAAGLARAVTGSGDLVFGMPRPGAPSPAAIAADFGLCARRALALAYILEPFPLPTHLELAASAIVAASEAYTAASMPAGATESAA